MGKRYTFWRMPDGKPYKGDDDKYALTDILAEISKMASINKDGNVQWHGFRIKTLEPAIRASIIVLGLNDEELNETDAWSIVQSSMVSLITLLGGGKPIPPKDLLTEADRRAAIHIQLPKAPYIFVTSLSVKSLPSGRLKVRECEIYPLKTRREFYIIPEALGHVLEWTRLGKHVKSTEYLPIRVKTAGRTIHEAVERASEAIILLCGYWNLFGTYGSWSLNMGTPTLKALGVIHKGPADTLHHPDGRSAADIYWYDPDFVEDWKLFQPNDGWKTLENRRRWAMNRVRHLPYRSAMEQLIARYASALDQPNLDVAFLQMWSILEKLTDTVGAKYDETIRRVVWPYKDRLLAKDLLEAVRYRRNQFVHAAKSGSDRDQMAYMIKSFVDPHLLRLIRNDFGVKTIEEYGRVLSLPTDEATLEMYGRHVRRAIRMSKSKAKPS